MDDVPLLIEFAPHTLLYRERDLLSQFPIVRNGPAGTLVIFPSGVRVSLPTDQSSSLTTRAALRRSVSGHELCGHRMRHRSQNPHF